MKSEDLIRLVSAAKAGKSVAWSDLMVALQRQLRVLIATYASSERMIDEVFRDCWASSHAAIAEAPATVEFVRWLARHAETALLRALESAGQEAITSKDALAHIVIRNGVERLQLGIIASQDTGTAVSERLTKLPEKDKQLLLRRYGQRQGRTAIAIELKSDEDAVAFAMCQARAWLDWFGEPLAMPDATHYRHLPILIDDYLHNALAAEERAQLATEIVSNLELSGFFERQVRIDLVLQALLEPENRDRARHAALELSQNVAKSRALASTTGRQRSTRTSKRTARASQRSSRRRRVPSESMKRPELGDARGRQAPTNHSVIIVAAIAGVVIGLIAFLIGLGGGSNAPASASGGAAIEKVSPATIAIAHPRDGASFTTKDTITIDVAVAGNATPRSVELLLDDQPIGERRAPPFGFVWRDGKPGRHHLSARLTDENGGIARAQAIEVTITP
jgi:DNA-directed RNA polymerase specialized sigma24 family protein